MITPGKSVGSIRPVALLARCGLAMLIVLAASMQAPQAQTEPVAKRQLAEGVTLEILELKRLNKKVLSLRFAIVNKSEEALRPRSVGVAHGGWMRAVILLDMENLKQYVVGGSSVGCLCSKAVEVPAGGRVEFWAHYGAPNPKVSKLAIQFAVAPPLFDIPITE